MSRRSGRAGNAIRGPQSALTDFLAAHNISAAQIRDDYEARRRAAQESGTPNDENQPQEADESEDDDNVLDPIQSDDSAATKKRKRRQQAVLDKVKKSKAYQKRKRQLVGEPGEDDDDEVALDLYQKSRPAPGQLDNCELCGKRFTVTPYSKTGPDGGLLCTKCSKEVEAEKKKDARAKKAAVGKDKRRKAQSNLLDGLAGFGAKALLELCVEKVADNIQDVDEFGDLPPALLDRLSQILSKRRVLDSRTLNLFLRPDLDSIAIYDCGKLSTDDYSRIFSVVPHLTKIDLRNACQLKDAVIDYIVDRQIPVRHLRLDAANLVSDEKWRQLLKHIGPQLDTLELSWLDNAFDDKTAELMAESCPNLRVLKLKKCYCMGDRALAAIGRLNHLEELSLALLSTTSPETLLALLQVRGPGLHKLSLRRFAGLDDQLLQTVHDSCHRLKKLCLTDCDGMTDQGFAALFHEWANPPLSVINFTRNRSLDGEDPEAPEDLAGLASQGFTALAAHSGSTIERLNVSSCRHISRATLLEIWDGKSSRFPQLQDLDVSFVSGVDNTVLIGLFRSCPALRKVAAFGCFDIQDVVVPRDIALIGVPRAQDSIVQEGTA